MKRWKVTPLADGPQGPSTNHETHVHVGDEDSLSVFLSDLQARTGTPYQAEEDTGEDARTDADRDAEAREHDERRARQDEAEERGRPV